MRAINLLFLLISSSCLYAQDSSKVIYTIEIITPGFVDFVIMKNDKIILKETAPFKKEFDNLDGKYLIQTLEPDKTFRLEISTKSSRGVFYKTNNVVINVNSNSFGLSDLDFDTYN